MKIGLITIYQVPNYGSVLQAFATQHMLVELGHECKIIKYKYPNEWYYKQGAPKPNLLKSFIRHFLPTKKEGVLNEFRYKYFHYTQKFYSLDDLKSADWSSYDVFIVGSDQVWNSRFNYGDSVFMLSFVPEGKPRYSLASSFALKSLPEQYRDKYKRELSKFTALSVREQNGVGIINNDLGIDKPVKVILDPTLLLSKEDWLKAIPRSKFKKTRPYILFYMWDYAFDPKPYIFEVTKYFQEKMNCDVIALEGYKAPEDAAGLVMENRCSSTLPEFIDLFANADLVITSSFHGTAFALNFGRPLVSVVPGRDDDRQSTILKRVGCEQCIITIGQALEDIKPEYDVNQEQQKLSELRIKSKEWIEKNICKHD